MRQLTLRRVTRCCLLTVVVFSFLGWSGEANADLNIVGSEQGLLYQGADNPSTGQLAVSIPLSLCDANSPMPERYENLANIQDLTDPSILIGYGRIVVWQCQVGGVPNFLFRYTASSSVKAYGNIKAPYVFPPGTPDPASLFTSIVPGGFGCTAALGNPRTDQGTGRQYFSFYNCSQRVLVQTDFATSDANGFAFTSSMCDPLSTPSCSQTITNTGVTTFPITATPFVVIVGNGVQKCDPVTKAAAGKIALTRMQLEAIFSGQVSSWNQLGYCVYPVAALSPPDARLGAGAGDMSPVGTPFNTGIDQTIVTCSRPWTEGTRAVIDATMMKDAVEISFGTVGPPFSGDINYLASRVSDGLSCVQGRSAPISSPANPNGIAYLRADEGINPLLFGFGNLSAVCASNGCADQYGETTVGRMRGGYPVAIDGALPSNYVPPAILANPTDAERSTSQKDFRCGRYPLWADWIGIQRNTSNPNQFLWNQYLAQIAQLLPKSPGGFFIARNLQQPGQPVNSEMAVMKGEPKGPIAFDPGDHPACR